MNLNSFPNFWLARLIKRHIDFLGQNFKSYALEVHAIPVLLHDSQGDGRSNQMAPKIDRHNKIS